LAAGFSTAAFDTDFPGSTMLGFASFASEGTTIFAALSARLGFSAAVATVVGAVGGVMGVTAAIVEEAAVERT
jgi:hypothetical protein